MSKHLPRRSGVGVRQVLPPAEPQIKPYRRRMAGPLLCGHENPERAGLFYPESGKTYIDPVTCTAQMRMVDGKPVRHRGPHRARLLRGVLVRWSA